MAFTWTSLPSVGGYAEVIDTKIQELRDNIDNLCGQVLISTPTWESLDSQGDYLKIYSMQDEIDNVDDYNYCRTECTSNNTTYESSDYYTQCTAVLGGNYSGAVFSENNPAYVANDAYDYGTDNSPDNITYVVLNNSGHNPNAVGDTY